MNTSRFKFPRRVRIHGGECGAVARALHHEAQKGALTQNEQSLISDECVLLSQADLGKASGSTIERKQMSTKTIFKRISLVVVTALGLGMSVVPASQAAFVAGSTTISASAVGRVGFGIDILVTSGSPTSATNNALNASSYVHAKMLSVPAGAGTLQLNSAYTSIASGAAFVGDSVTVAAATADGTGLIQMRTDSGLDTYAAGTYEFLVWADATVGGTTAPAATAAQARISVTLGGSPTSIVWDATSATADSSSVTNVRIAATIRDANGVATLLQNRANETLTIRTNRTAPGTARIADTISVAGVTTVDSTVANQYSSSLIYMGTAATNIGASTRMLQSRVEFYVGNSDATTTTFTILGQGDLLGISSGAFTLTMANPAVITRITPNTSTARQAANNRADTSSATLGVKNSSYGAAKEFEQADGELVPTAVDLFVSTVTGKTLSFGVTTASSSGGLIVASVAARTGVILPTGITAGSLNRTVDTEFAYLSLAATAPNAGEGYDITFGMSNGKSVTYSVTYKAPTVSNSTGEGSVVTNLDGNTMKAAVGSTNTVTFTVKDGFGSVVSGATVRFQHNRTANNAYSDLVSGTTDASGNVSFTFTDALTLAASGLTTLNRAGTVQYYVSTANASTNLTSTRSINYTTAAFVTPGAITATGNEVTDAVGAASGTYNLVDTVISETITVTTDTGAVMTGIPYSATLSAGLYERLNYASGLTQLSGFTNSSGQAFIRVACYKSGAQTVTWTVGTLTKAVNFTCQSTSGKLRAISVGSTTATAAVDKTAEITVTATDIYGNVVPSASLTVTYTGANGRIVSYNGAQGATATTDSAGKLVIGVYADKAGSGTLRITTTGGVLATTTTTTQGVAPIARVDDLSVTVTSTGVSSVEAAANAATAAAEAATDAAAEAIDAANAATDAANLSAEAADAATVAAEEARDAADAATAAVEELATQVATLMAALKAQITTLANTVAKIAKKVKA